MAITVKEFNKLSEQKEDRQDDVSTGNEFIYLIPQDYKVAVQWINKTAGEVELMTSMEDYSTIKSAASFAGFASEMTKTVNFVATQVNPGLTAVGVKVNSGTWDIIVKLQKDVTVRK